MSCRLKSTAAFDIIKYECCIARVPGLRDVEPIVEAGLTALVRALVLRAIQ
jgi:hypothetical protein